MGNPFEKPTRREEYQATREQLGAQEKKKDKLEAPFGHLATDDLLGNMFHETLNAVASLPDTPKIKYLELKIKLAQRKLESIYAKDQQEAINLNKKYDALVKEAAKSGDDTKVTAFEKEKLGM